MRKWTVLLLIALITMFLVACNKEDKKDSEERDDTPKASEQEKDSDDKPKASEQENDSDDSEADNDLGFDFNPTGENIVTLQSEQNGVKVKLVYTATGDKVSKQTAENVIPYQSFGVQTADEAKEIPELMALIEQYKEIKGIEHKMDFQEEYIYEDLEVNYDVIEYDEVKDLLGFQSEGDLTNGVSLKRSIEMLKRQGFEIVK